ncbi:hypothetical protein BDW22DRAFT_1360125 [Trametopsis cervina]|nr:hypothetical protein BDW22DRAFT_1360125 [Trametopsis cervina]
MAPQSKPFEFNIKTVQSCFDYLSDALTWLLSLDDHELLRISRELEIGMSAAPRLPDFLVERIRALFRTVQRVRNRYPAINRLPTELLSAVFEATMPVDPRITFDDRRKNGDEEDHYYDDDESIGKAGDPVSHAAPSLVCRHWRDVVLGTPALWTDIRVSSRALSRNSNNPHGTFISTQLARSGVRLLNVQLDQALSPASLQLPFIQDLLKHAHRIRRLTMSVQSTDNDAEIRLWTANARQLDVLDISCAPRYLSASRPLLPSSEAHAPRLQTLVMYDHVRWRAGMFRTLRHLLVHFRSVVSMVGLARELMDVFASNAHTLEDLVVSDGIQWLTAEAERVLTNAPEGVAVAPVDMPALRRLAVRGTPLFHKIIEPRLVLHACARDYDFSRFRNDPRFLPSVGGDSNLLSVNKLFVTSMHAMGTDGTAAVRTLNRSLGLVDTRDVKQLWLSWGSNTYFMYENLELMRAVEKLVVLRSEGEALVHIAKVVGLLPALSELQLYPQQKVNYREIVDFLAVRKADGRAIKTLRLVHDPRVVPNMVGFGMFVERRSELESYVANVVYDDAPRDTHMELPAVCTAKSLIHAYWDPWTPW